jgi:hypothetical protein
MQSPTYGRSHTRAQRMGGHTPEPNVWAVTHQSPRAWVWARKDPARDELPILRIEIAKLAGEQSHVQYTFSERCGHRTPYTCNGLAKRLVKNERQWGATSGTRTE